MPKILKFRWLAKTIKRIGKESHLPIYVVLIISILIILTSLVQFRLTKKHLLESVLNEAMGNIELLDDTITKNTIGIMKGTLTLSDAHMIYAYHTSQENPQYTNNLPPEYWKQQIQDSFDRLGSVGSSNIKSRIYIDQNGNTIAYSNRSEENQLSEEKINSLLVETSGIGKNSVYMSPIDKESDTFLLAAPHRSFSGKQLGIVIMEVDMEELVKHSTRNTSMLNRFERQVILADENGNYIHVDSLSNGVKGPNVEVDFPKIHSNITSGKPGIMQIDSKIVAFSPITFSDGQKEIEWYIIGTFPRNDVLSSILYLRNTLIGITLGLIGIIGLIALAVSRIADICIKDFSEKEEEERPFTIAEKKRWKVLEKLDEQ